MATHPVEREKAGPGEESATDAQPNTSHLPVEPEFVPELHPAGEPEDPHAKPAPP